jgi:hypothetical protein
MGLHPGVQDDGREIRGRLRPCFNPPNVFASAQGLDQCNRAVRERPAVLVHCWAPLREIAARTYSVFRVRDLYRNSRTRASTCFTGEAL